MIRQKRRPYMCAAITVIFLVLAGTLQAEITIVLQNDFIEHYKRRVCIDAEFIVDKAHKKPNPPSKDGDLHIAGRSEDIKLPVVAEIMNAKHDLEAVKMVHAAEGTGKPLAIAGPWRLWCEHGGDSEQIQGAPLKPFTTTNPDHVFEIHPVTQLNGRSLLLTLKPIVGFKTKDAERAFLRYEGIRCRIIPGDEFTTLITTMAGYNYVEFIMEINGPIQTVDDGLLVMCKVRDLEGELLVRNRRMVLPKDSEAEKKTRGMPKGTQLHVLGIPRINLSLVSWRVKAASDGRKEVLAWGLPYEIIVVGFYGYVIDGDDQPSVGKKALLPNRRFAPRTLTPKEIEKHRGITPPPDISIRLPSVPTEMRLDPWRRRLDCQEIGKL